MIVTYSYRSPPRCETVHRWISWRYSSDCVWIVPDTYNGD